MTITSQQRDAGTAPVSRLAKWAPLAVILTGTFIYILDFFVVNVALPDIQGSLHASAAAIEWLVSGYALTSASLLVCSGRLGDHYGRRRCFCIGLAAFVLASALCAIAPDPGFLIAARLVQGAGGAIMAPNIMSLLGMTYGSTCRSAWSPWRRRAGWSRNRGQRRPGTWTCRAPPCWRR